MNTSTDFQDPEDISEEQPTSTTEEFALDPLIDLTASVPKYKPTFGKRDYVDKEFKGTQEERTKKIETSSTVYVGNLTNYTSEYQIHALFSRCGPIKRVVMGLDRNTKKKCGFCFVEYDNRDSAILSIQYLKSSCLDNRRLSIDIDAGFEEGRQFGRGKSGGQVCDDRDKERKNKPYNDDSFDQPMRSRRGGFGGPGGQRRNIGDSTRFLTGSLTFLALIGLLLSLILCTIPDVDSSIILHPSTAPRMNPTSIRRFQKGEGRKDFETAFARLLVNVMKSAKPSLMKAFMKATLEDKKLKEIAIGIFFNNTETTNNNDDDLRRRR